MSSSIFSETVSARPSGADGDSNLVVVYSKNGISFDERAIENILEEKSIASISVVRLTSPTPSMIDQEEIERLEELERFLEMATDREDSDADRDTDNDSQSGGDEVTSEKDHITGDDNDNNTDGENNDDSTENEAEAPKVRKRPGRKPKPPKKVKKRRKPKERPQIVGLSVEQFYVESSADLVVKNALKLAGISVFKRTPQTDALLEIIKNDHNYTPFTSPEQMKAQKTAEKLAMDRQTAQGRKFIVHTQTNVKMLNANAKKRFQVVPIGHVQPARALPQQQQLPKQLPKQQLQQPPAVQQKQPQIIIAVPRPVRNSMKVITPVDIVEDDEDAHNSSASADDENADTEDFSDPTDESRETDNDRDSDIDFKMNNSRSSNKRKRIKKLSKRPQIHTTRAQAAHASKALGQAPKLPGQPVHAPKALGLAIHAPKVPGQAVHASKAPGQVVHAPKALGQALHAPKTPGQGLHAPKALGQGIHAPKAPGQVLHAAKTPGHVVLATKASNQAAHATKVPLPSAQPQFSHLKRRKEQTDVNSLTPAIGQIVQLQTKAPASVIALGRNMPSTSFLKMRPTHKSLSTGVPITPEAARMCASAATSKVRRTPLVQVGRVVASSPGGFMTPSQSQDVKEIIINKNLASPKGVFTNLNSLLADSNNMTVLTTSTPDTTGKQRLLTTPITPKSSLSNLATSPASSTKGFMPIGVQTATSHKLPAQIIIETHQSSSELAAENDKQLDLINSIVQDELLKASLVEQPPASADENIPKLVKMLESSASAAGLNKLPSAADLNQLPSATGMNQVTGENSVAKLDTETINAPQQTFNTNMTTNDSIDIGSARLLNTPDEDEITADFLQHVVGLIEEDKQFEAEVVKQVLESTETCGLDAIANAVSPAVIYESAATQLPRSLAEEFNAHVIPTSLANLPMACSTPARSISTLTLANSSPRPDVKVVRGNGRVIYLPPIEAPTTRAKRRAQNYPVATSNSADISNISALNEPMQLDSSSVFNSSLDSDSFLPQTGGVSRRQLYREPAGNVRRPRRSNKLNISQLNDADASESQEDDDDPNKLWCICRQPHNNRFMICCDLCEDWYHGTCVSVTKAMGLEMEQKGIDWKCPKCVKKQEEKSQPRITDMLLPLPSGEPAEIVTLARQSNETKVTAVLQQLTPVANAVATVAVVLPTTSTATTTSSSSTLLKQSKRQQNPVNSRPAPKMLQQQQLHFIKLGSSSSIATVLDAVCVVCKRAARVNSVYCSDECIRKYAQSAIQAQTVAKTPEPIVQQAAATQLAPLLPNALESKKSKKKDLFEDVLRQADSVSKVERINVFERRSGRALTGHMAPSAQQLKKWLQDNPSFEVVQPGSPQALEIEKRLSKRLPDVTSPEATVTKPFLMAPIQKASEPQRRSIQLLTTLHVPVPAKKEKLPTPSKATPNTATRSPEKSNAERTVSNSQPEPIRFNVRRTLKEQLLSRIKEAQATERPMDNSEWLTATEVEHFVKRVESEMFHSFGRDVSAKYKSKYRSLMFNIRDRKNKTLFEKICAKQVEPKQLVRMTPAELASQELAKWREEENRHQLEMIKKSELDLLSCAQNYVVKTHKGEEVIETKVNLTLPEEQLELDLNNEMLDSSDDKKASQSMEMSTATDGSSKELNHERSTVKDKLPRTREKERSRERDRGKERERDRRHKSHKHHHHSGAKRSRSRSNSRGRSLERRSHKRHHHEHDLDKEKEQPPRDKPIYKERSEKVQSPVQKQAVQKKQVEKKSAEKRPVEKKSVEKKPVEKRPVEKKPVEKKPIEKKAVDKKPESTLTYSLIDQILESEKTVEQAANLTLPSPKQTLKSVHMPVPTPLPVPTPVPVPMPVPDQITARTDVHPPPTLDKYARYVQSLPRPSLWSGNLHMVDVTDFNVVIHSVHGDTSQLGKLLPSNLDVIGRITGVNVWDYLKKIKKSPTKEIVVVHLFPAAATDTANFDSFFDYLDSRQRLGVLGADTEQIRDFYIFPLGTRDSVPSVLHTLDSVPFYEDTQRPNTLLGIIVRCLSKRLVNLSQTLPLPLPTTSNSSAKVSVKGRGRMTFTPPGSPKRKHGTHSPSPKDDEFDIDAIIKAPIAKLQKINQTNISLDPIVDLDDPNAPYSPSGSCDDNDNNDLPANKGDLERKVDEINKQIAAQRMEIAGLLNVESSAGDKPTSSSSLLANISIPPNLTKLLASLKEKNEANIRAKSGHEEYKRNDAITSSRSYSMANKSAESATKTRSRLAQLSEAELLSMVPDNLVDLPFTTSTRQDEPPPPGV